MNLLLVANAETLFYQGKRGFTFSFSKYFCVVSFFFLFKIKVKSSETLCVVLSEEGKEK